MHAVHWNKQTATCTAASGPRGVGQALVRRQAEQKPRARACRYIPTDGEGSIRRTVKVLIPARLINAAQHAPGTGAA